MKKNNKKQQKSHYHGKCKKENMKEHVMKPKDAEHDFTTVTPKSLDMVSQSEDFSKCC